MRKFKFYLFSVLMLLVLNQFDVSAKTLPIVKDSQVELSTNFPVISYFDMNQLDSVPQVTYRDHKFPKETKVLVKEGNVYYTFGNDDGNIYIQNGRDVGTVHESPTPDGVYKRGWIADASMELGVYSGDDSTATITANGQNWNFIRVAVVPVIP